MGKKGVVRDPQVHMEVINKVIACAGGAGLSCQGMTFSPIKGPKGNIEYLLLFRPNLEETGTDWTPTVQRTVNEAHQQLGNAK